MNLNIFMQNGIEGILKTAGRFYLSNAKGRAFLTRMLPHIRRSAAVRDAHEKAGRHVPPFLIASIASQCNLRCAGCYARAGGSCAETASAADLSGDEWARIFEEAAALGTSFILLAGGEPLLRKDVLHAAARCGNVVFPIFTNGTMLDADDIAFMDRHRNLIPVFSMEGTDEETDARRGAGVSSDIRTAMGALHARRVLFGASITVTRSNIEAVLNPAYVSGLRKEGCGLVFYVEYVPAERGTEHLALRDDERAALRERTEALRGRFADTVIVSFPGDEEAMGGCLASGRGFFHINPAGGAEPCPFSPYARHNLKEASLLEVIESGYFDALRALAMTAGPHTGGCVLFEREQQVKALLAREA